jgi:hypothetical protein
MNLFINLTIMIFYFFTGIRILRVNFEFKLKITITTSIFSLIHF